MHSQMSERCHRGRAPSPVFAPPVGPVGFRLAVCTAGSGGQYHPAVPPWALSVVGLGHPYGQLPQKPVIVGEPLKPPLVILPQEGVQLELHTGVLSNRDQISGDQGQSLHCGVPPSPPEV